jgi:hypothetical protein
MSTLEIVAWVITLVASLGGLVFKDVRFFLLPLVCAVAILIFAMVQHRA